MDGVGKVEKLKEYGLKLTKEVESEVADMCTYATAMENKGIEKGIEKGIAQGIEKGIAKGIKEGRTSGQNDLVEAIGRLRQGDSREDIVASGIDEHTVDLAMVVK